MLVILLLRLIKIISPLGLINISFTVNSIDGLLVCADEVQAIAEMCILPSCSLQSGEWLGKSHSATNYIIK